VTLSDLIAEIEATPPLPSGGEAVARGAAQGATLGYGDEMLGAISAIGAAGQQDWPQLPGPRKLKLLYPGIAYPEAMAKWKQEHNFYPAPEESDRRAAESRGQASAAYGTARDRDRASNEAARAAHPGKYLLSQLAAGAVPALATGGGVGPAIAVGAVQGGGYSDADSAGRLVGDIAVGGALGGLGYGAGQALTSVARRVAGGVQNKLGQALARATAEEAKKRAAAVQSAAGSLGGARAEANRVVEAIRGLLTEPDLTDAQRATLAGLRGTPEYAQAVQSLVKSLEARLPDVAGKVAQGEMGVAAARALPSVPELAAERVGTGAAKEQILARLRRYGPPMVGSALGSAVGGAPGAAIGALAGAGTRPAIHALRRMVQDPAVQTQIMRPILGAARSASSPAAQSVNQAMGRVAFAGTAPAVSGSLADYLSKSKEEREAEAELERLLRE